MLFSVIYTADYAVPTGEFYGENKIDDVAPPRRRQLWELTEAHDEEAYWNPDRKERHRKWAALLTREQFEEFLRHTWLTADETETMGSIGAPGFGFGWAPAISFSYDYDNGDRLNAYVTPIPEVCGKPSIEGLARHQGLVFDAVRSVYGGRDGRFIWDKAA